MDSIYKLTDNKLTNILIKFHFLFTRKRLSNLINEINPDVIVCNSST